jgi:hypothetical protein
MYPKWYAAIEACGMKMSRTETVDGPIEIDEAESGRS